MREPYKNLHDQSQSFTGRTWYKSWDGHGWLLNLSWNVIRLQEFCDPTQTLVLCEREWGAKEIRKLNAGFKAKRET